ncbi:hypothetical protein TUM12370_24730 [Salmonella enterica subsp. enterica serovar Choleraesuis]|nr:hypothetical protein TUM12370_24730 [Salmonella enterica subsp. enterica serovar Choleraesuis]
MARIRTVKPEFWTDEKVVECSIPARLMFIGLFNFANDRGCLERSPKRLKMQIFPADVIDCEPLIKELIAHGLLTEYSVSGNEYLHIKGFLRHQKINRPSVSKLPLPPELAEKEEKKEQTEPQPLNEELVRFQTPLSEPSMRNQGGLTDGREKEGKRSKELEREKGALEEFSQSVFATPVSQIGKIQITTDWLPGNDFVRQAALWGINLGTEPGYTPEELQQFRDYWICEGRVKHQQQWEQTFAQSLRSSRGSTVAGQQRRKNRNDLPGVSVPDNKIPPGFRG